LPPDKAGITVQQLLTQVRSSAGGWNLEWTGTRLTAGVVRRLLAGSAGRL
jgi:hypothetical protein